jgi:hypothetical protein
MKMVKKADNQFSLINTFSFNLSNERGAVGNALLCLLSLPLCGIFLVSPPAPPFNRSLS